MTEEIQVKPKTQLQEDSTDQTTTDEESKMWNNILEEEREYRHQRDTERYERFLKLQKSIFSPFTRLRHMLGFGPSKAEKEYEQITQESSRNSDLSYMVRADRSNDYGTSRSCWEEIYIRRSDDKVQKAYQMRVSQYDEKMIRTLRMFLLQQGIRTNLERMKSRTNQDISQGPVVSGLYQTYGDDSLNIQEGDLVLRTHTPTSAYYVRHNLLKERVFGFKIDEDLLPMTEDKYIETRQKELKNIESLNRTTLLVAMFFNQRRQEETQDSTQEMTEKLGKFLEENEDKEINQIISEIRKNNQLGKSGR